MEIIKTPSHRPTSLHVAFCIWILSTVCSLQSGTSSLQGMKVLFQGQQCQYWELKQGRMVPPLEQLTVCVDLCRQTNTKKWTAFTYNRVDQPTQNTPELGLAGYEDKLQVWLFGESFNASVELSLWSWNSICFTWSSKTKQLVLYVNGSSVFNTTLTGPRHLAPNGTLTLGAAHEISNGQVHIKTANNFLGELYFFRMWKEERSAHELSEDRCNNGSVIQWHSDNWNTHSCNLEPDTKLQCAPLEDHPTLPRPKGIAVKYHIDT
ncbi:adhesion G-protein coupled receptor G4 [Amia ocellicauda]|uniref:adhesion G-protein coupled receptor G4 n=1 Tax=Amia ocellicauda TaxID=2972642 RepID=UPI003463B79A